MEEKENLVPELDGVDLQPQPGEEEHETDLDLDEILKEFSDPKPEPVVSGDTVQFEAVTEEMLVPEKEEVTEDTVAFTPVAEKTTEDTVAFTPVAEKTTEDTVAFTPVAEKASEDTVAFEPVTEDTVAFQKTSGDTVSFEPVGENEQETLAEMNRQDQERLEQLQQETGEEPYSEQWEPEYEQPMGEYVPEPAIIYHPRSRLKELKRKLIEGPEKRYYALQDQGLGKLYFATFICLLAVLASIGISVLRNAGLVLENRPKLMVFSQLFLMFVVALLGNNQLVEGITDLCKGRFTLNTMLVLSFVACCADGVLCLSSLRVPCCAAFNLQMLMSMWSAGQKRSTEMGIMDTMRKAVRLDKVAAENAYFGKKRGLLRGEAQVEDVMDTYNKPAAPERFQNFCGLAALVLSVALAVVAYVYHDLHTAAQVLSVSLLAGVPAAAFISVSRPMAILEKRMHKHGVVFCGWRGIKGLKANAVLPVDHNDLFPEGTVKMNGVKFFSSRDTDEIVAYAAALVCANGGGLAPLFEQLLQSRNGRHYTVKALRSYEGGGIGGEILDEPVLVGLLPFLQDMGVEIPEGLRVDQAVCVAIDGELCGLFALSYERTGAVVDAVHTLSGCMGVKPVLTNTDFMLSKNFLRAKFGIRPKKLITPTYEQCNELRKKTLSEDAPALMVTTKEGLNPIAYGLAGAKAMHTAGWMGAVLHLLGGLVGLGIVAIMVFKSGLGMLTPANIFLFQMAWIIPAFLISEWTRTI